MNVYKWILVAYMALQCMLLVGKVGKPRPIITPAVAVVGLVEFAVIAWLVVIA